MTGPELATARLRLRLWRDSDLEPFAAINADPEVTRYLGGPRSREESDALVRDRIEPGFAERGYGWWAVERRDEPGLLGFVGLKYQTFDAAFTPATEVGWRLGRAAWGHGYATEAATAALDFGFGPAGLVEIVSMTVPANARSRAVMERLGMTRDPADDFDHPDLPVGHPLRRHVLYRIGVDAWRARRR